MPHNTQAFAEAHRKKRRWLAAVSCLAALVVFGTVGALVLPARTLEGATYCGMEEHTHEENCYTSVLTCGLTEESGHVHQDSCYATELTCPLAEHTHTDACYVNPEAQDVETQEAQTGTETGTEPGTGSADNEAGNTENTVSDNGGTVVPEEQTGEGTVTDDTQAPTAVPSVPAEDTADDPNGENPEEETAGDVTEENPQAALEAAALPEGAQVPEGYTQRYTVRDDVNGFAVTVYAPEGVVPEGAVLSAELLSEDNDAYTAAETALEENGANLAEPQTLEEDGETAEDSYGFAAFDIHFEDANGTEVEPAGDVYVVIDAEEMLPENADPDSVAVQHHAEQDDGQINVETVADTADETEGVVTAQTTEDSNSGSVQAAFGVSGFSTFTITWNASGSRSVRVSAYCYDNDTKQELTNGITGNLWIATGNEFRFTNDNPKLQISGWQLDHVTMRIGNTEYDNVYSFTALYDWTGHTYSYSYKQGENGASKSIRDPRNITFYLYYARIDEVATADLTIESDIAESGSLCAEYSGNTDLNDGNEYFYKWYRLGVNDYEEISGEIESAIEIFRDGARATYRVELWQLKDGATTMIARSDPYQVPYYNQLQNGGFSEPVVEGSNLQFTNDLYPELVWKTTGEGEPGQGGSSGKLGQDIEIINTRPENDSEQYNMTSYRNYGVKYARDNDYQLAELNCEAAGALYQDVLTIPDENLYWWASHRPRSMNGAGEVLKDPEDTMYVIIMDAEIAEKYVQTQDQINAIVRAAGDITAADDEIVTDNTNNSKTIRMTYGGQQVNITIWKLTSDINTNQRGGWHDYGALYTVPEGQYLTRFFFAAGTTATGSSTVGNLIDRVGFSQYPPTAENEGRIVITKNLEGIDDTTKIPEGTFQFKIDNTTISLPTEDASITDTEAWTTELNLTPGIYSIIEEISYQVDDYQYQRTTTAVNAQVEEGLSRQVIVRDGATTEVVFTNEYIPKTVSLTLTKEFDGLSDAEVSYLLFGANLDPNYDGFGFDVNYCVTQPREEDGGLTYMAPQNDIKGYKLPDGTSLENKDEGGGGYRIVAGQYLSNKNITNYGDSYTDSDTGASLIKNSEGNWVYSITLEVPACDSDHFFTVFEQHQEVPGYAKINDSNAEWVIQQGTQTVASGTGKFIEDGKNIYEDMNSELGEKDSYREQEDHAISLGALRQIKVDRDTTISFTNHYTGKLDVKKVIGVDNEYTGADTKEYTLKIAPANSDKLINSGSSLDGKIISYTINDENNPKTVTLDSDGSFTVTIQKDQTLHLVDLPAIQWKVTEENYDVNNYTWTGSYSDENRGVVNTYRHWNGYVETDTIGGTSATDVDNGKGDGIASVDSAVCSIEAIDGVPSTPVKRTAVALVTVTNSYKHNVVDITVVKMDMELKNSLPGAEFYLYKMDGTTKLYYPDNGGAWVNGSDTAKLWTSGQDGTFKIEGLEDGTYYLEEVKAPDGYILPNEDASFVITNGTITGVSGNGSNKYDAELKLLRISNTTGAKLPETGGTGTTLVTIGGLMLMAAAVGGGYGLRRRRERRSMR